MSTMFLMHMPWTFRLGSRAPVRINGESATLWWRDADTLVIDEIDARRICDRQPVDENLQLFICADADGSEYGVTYEDDDGRVIGPK